MQEVTLTKKTIDDLPTSEEIEDTDNFIILRDGLAYRMTSKELMSRLVLNAKLKFLVDEATAITLQKVVNGVSTTIYNDTIHDGEMIEVEFGTYVVTYDTNKTINITVNQKKIYDVILE